MLKITKDKEMKMKKSKLLLLLLLVLVCAFTVTSCALGGSEKPSKSNNDSTDGDSEEENPPDGGEEEEESATYTVTVIASDTAAVEFPDGNRKTVKEGESVSFKVKFSAKYKFLSTSHGTYDTATQTLTITDVKSNLRVNFSVEELPYAPGDKVYVKFNHTAKDSASHSTGEIEYGTKITLIAGDNSRYFKGWSVGGVYTSSNAVMISTERNFEFTLLPEHLCNLDFVNIYPNYADTNVLYYHPNGAMVKTDSVNMKGNNYYKTELSSGKVKVTLSENYVNYAECASTFWDDGTFYLDGYVLTEYNTKPDGTGESYSLGSKCYAPSLDSQTLYCIWKKATDASDFTYVDASEPYMEGTDATKAPHWKTSGVKITGYKGNDSTVVIPETIDGKPVIGIATGAFVGKQLDTLVISKHVLRIDNGAFFGCSSLRTVYMSDGIAYMENAALDSASYTSLTNFYLNAVMAPRFTKNDGAFAVKLSRILASQDKNRVIVVSGSSTYQGLGTAYLEALLDGEYTVINMGTTRTGTGMIFFEAMQHYTHEGDIVVYAPENHVNMFGNNTMWYRSFYDTEGMYNLFRYIDISHYPSVFSALSAYNRDRRFNRAPVAYEDIVSKSAMIDKYGDYHNDKRGYYRENEAIKYIDSYFITLNRYYKNDLKWDDVDYQTANKDYIANTNGTWEDITIYKDEVNRAIALIKATGATVVFGFAPVDADDVVPEAQNKAWLDAYDKLIEDNYNFDALLGSSKDYVFAHTYFYDCAYHVNDYGRTYRSYQLYLDLCELLGKENIKKVDAVGKNFKGCLFEEGAEYAPLTKVSYLN